MSSKLQTKFVHLHTHTHYSLLDGLSKIPALLDRAQELGMDAIAVTDHGNLYGAIEFYKEARTRGIKPIIGCEMYVAPRKHTDKQARVDSAYYHLILLAKNNTGWENLIKLVSIAQTDGFYYKPRVDKELLKKYHEGLIALSACAHGEVAQNISMGSYEGAKKAALEYKKIFTDGFYLELQDHQGWDVQDKINEANQKLSKELDIPLVATKDSHYILPEDKEAQDVLIGIQTGKTLEDEDRLELHGDLSLSSPEDMAKSFSQNPEAVSNTVKIAQMCDWSLDLGKIHIPPFKVPKGAQLAGYLHKKVYNGLAWRYMGAGLNSTEEVSTIKPKLPPHILERAEYELGVISKMGYESYFLIIEDFVSWAKARNIVVGPGRGSAAGSIVSYSLNITDLDPLEYDLLFERFLNPDRIAMPDIDMDFEDVGRPDVIAYVTEKYGKDHVAQIITFGTLAARNAIRDTGRVLGMGYGEVDAIAKVVPLPIQGRHTPLAVSVKENPELKQVYESNPQAKRLINLAMRIEGCVRHASTHAAGVVITEKPVTDYVPIQKATRGDEGIITQIEMNALQDDLGLLKMDFLGLSNLTILKNTLRIIKKVYGDEINLKKLALDDKKTFALLSRAETVGVFQLESAGMQRYLKQLKPNVFDDIIAMGALYRPGPMQWIDDFINRKHGKSQVEYLHPVMESALKPTYGILVYQEQVMEIAKKMCGFTGGQADTLRKAVAKKKPEVMARVKQDFIEGAISTSSVKREVVEKFWQSLEAFAAYCFPKAHAACYALIAYQTAYLKAHYPSAFMAALLTSDHGNIDRIALEVAECGRLGVKVLAPDVNESFAEFSVIPDSGDIRFGMSAIKNVGEGAIEAILEARERDGKFANIADFARRVNYKETNKKVYESLIKCGAFDSMGDRATLLENMDLIMDFSQKVQAGELSGQTDIFNLLGITEEISLQLVPPAAALHKKEILAWEKELLGLYISEHPLKRFSGQLSSQKFRIGELTTKMEGELVDLMGVITSVRKIYTRNNQPMAFAAIEDLTGSVEVIVFPKTYEQTSLLWEVDQIVRVTGKINTKDRQGVMGAEVKVMADTATLAEEALHMAPVSGGLVIKVEQSSPELIVNLKKLIQSYPGNITVYLELLEQNKKIRLNHKIDPKSEFLEELSSIVGEDNIFVPNQPKALQTG